MNLDVARRAYEELVRDIQAEGELTMRWKHGIALTEVKENAPH